MMIIRKLGMMMEKAAAAIPPSVIAANDQLREY
jgi:hypothetical protein